MDIIYYSREEIERAREMDLLTYLRLYEPENLIHVGANVYSTREHDSLKISNGKWMWWSREFGGASALDYLIKVKGISFPDAMAILTGRKENSPSSFSFSGSNKKPGRLLLPEKSESVREITAYLSKRGIARNIIEILIEDGLLYESLPQHSCIFVGKDGGGIPRYAAYRACTDERILGEAAGSDKSYPFRIEAPDSPVLHLFEGAIDLLSYATVRQRHSLKWNEENLLSMGGISVSKTGRIPIAIKRFLEENAHIDTIHIHFDKDSPGLNAAESLKNALDLRYQITLSPPPYGKDYNDYLQKLIKEDEEIWRINYGYN